MTLTLNPNEEAQELHELLGDIRELLLLRVKRKGVTGRRITVVGKLLNHLDELEALNCPEVHAGADTQPEAALATVAGQA